MKAIRLTFYILLTALFWTTGCGIFFPAPDWHPFTSRSDPLVGWKVLLSHDYEKFDKAITDDYQDYIQKLPAEDRKYAGPIWFYEDGTGRHAVRIEIEYGGTIWEHVLIYDKDNKRMKAIKYYNGRYMS